MYTAQRRLQPESRSSSRQSSRPSSKPGSRSASKLGARIIDDDTDYTSSLFLSLAQNDLNASLSNLALPNSDEDESSGKVSVKDTFSDSVEILSQDRRNTSLEAREKALYAIVNILSQKFEPEKFSNSLFDIAVKALQTSRSETESLLALKATCLLSALDVDASFETLTNSVIPSLQTRIADYDTGVDLRANMTMGYSLLNFFVQSGSGCFNVVDTVDFLLDTASSCDNEEAAVASAAILGAGLLTSILPSPNTTIENTFPLLVDFLEDSSSDVRQAAGKVMASFMQIFEYHINETDREVVNSENENETADLDSIPGIDYWNLIVRLKELTGESSKRISKKDKKEQRSLLRDVLRTAEQFSTSQSRESLLLDDLVITHLKLSRGRSLSIESWNKLIRVQHFKWLYAAGTQSQLANNPILEDAIKSSTLVLESVPSAELGEVDQAYQDNFLTDITRRDYLKATSDERSKAKQNQISRQRDAKVQLQEAYIY